MNRSTIMIVSIIVAVGLFCWIGLPMFSPPDDVPGPVVDVDPGELQSNTTVELAPEMHPAPQFTLTDQSGETFESTGLAGTVWIANFMFTQCKATCPLQAEAMLGIQNGLAEQLVRDDVQLVSISVDPENDTAEVLKAYAEKIGANTQQWHFLTGQRDAIWNLSKELNMAIAEDSDNAEMPIAHDSKFILVDRGGTIRGYYDILNQEGMRALQRSLHMVLPEIPPSMLPESYQPAEAEEVTHIAQPPEIIRSAWIPERIAAETKELENSSVMHDFAFRNAIEESGIDLNPLIVDEQRWRLKVNHYDHGNGIVVADVDGDGRLDVYFVSQAGANGLYRNLGDGKFENITESAGVALADRIGVSAAFADIDNDGDSDLFVTTIRNGNALFLNDGTGKFSDISEAAGVDYSGHSSAAVFFDYDKDGLLDLFVTNVGKYTTQENVRLRLDGTSPTQQGEYHYYLGTADAFAGHLKPELNEASILYRNLGENRFEDVSEAVGLVDTRWSGAATPLDANGDGWLDLYVLNMQGHDEYYENIEGKRFEAKGKVVFPRTSWGAMGVKWFDYDNDGHLDLYVTDMHSDMSFDVDWTKEYEKADMKWANNFLQSTPAQSIFGNSFYRNKGDGTFEEVSDRIGAENYWPWGLSVGDLNADGFTDAFLASSMCLPYRFSMNSVFLNEGGKRFVPAECALRIEPRPRAQRIKPWFELDADGIDKENPICQNRTGKIVVWSALGSRSSVIFDLDEDGDLDVITHDFGSRPQVFLSNLVDSGKPANFLKLAFKGVSSNRDGLGARVVVRSGDLVQTKVNDGQSGYLSQSTMPLYFGLGEHQVVDSIEVTWPSGKKETKDGPIDAGQLITLEEPEA